ncbi:MAG: aminopeptidase P family protein [Acidobacteria bacterium]|nr:aminopeptidase P family protein [Acidobacteriota bacterium]
MERRNFLQYAGAGAVGLLSSRWAKAQTQTAQRRTSINLSGLAQYPTLSLKERDWRWNRARKMMQDAKVDCLLVMGNGADNYFTNDSGSTLIFPIQGEPIALSGSSSSQAGNWLQNEERGEESWVRDWRFRDGGEVIVEVLKEKGFASSRIGTIGVSTTASSSAGRFGTGVSVGHAEWETITAGLPQAKWQELWDTFLVMWLTKSDEDLAIFRKASLMAEAASLAAWNVTKPGVTEADIYAAIQCEILRLGGRTGSVIMHSGPDNVSWGSPKWQIRPQKPRVIQGGDIITTEIFPHYGHLQAQAQMCIGVGKVADVNIELGKQAREAYEIGLKTAKPGIKFADLANAMNEPNIKAGNWLLTPHIHSMNPVELVGPLRRDRWPGYSRLRERFKDLPLGRALSGGDVVLQAGMCFQLEPNANRGRNRVNIGGNIIITKDGCEELNDVPCALRMV